MDREREMDTPQGVVTLYEEADGSLYIAVDGIDGAYDMTARRDESDFRVDAAALLRGETEDWPVPSFPAASLGTRVPWVADYVGHEDTVRVGPNVLGGMGRWPGHAAMRYLGPDAPEE